jgi:hypothetical protein
MRGAFFISDAASVFYLPDSIPIAAVRHRSRTAPLSGATTDADDVLAVRVADLADLADRAHGPVALSRPAATYRGARRNAVLRPPPPARPAIWQGFPAKPQDPARDRAYRPRMKVFPNGSMILRSQTYPYMSATKAERRFGGLMSLLDVR